MRTGEKLKRIRKFRGYNQPEFAIMVGMSENVSAPTSERRKKQPIKKSRPLQKGSAFIVSADSRAAT